MSQDSKHIPVRLSHLFRHCAVGAIVRGAKYLVVVADIRKWTDRRGEPSGRPILYVEQVRATLGIVHDLREPPIAAQGDNGRIDEVAIPAFRFPNWMRCQNPACGQLYYRPWLDQGDAGPRCLECDNHPALEQVSWALVHSDGYLADVPWHYIAHRDARDPEQRACKEDRHQAHLRLTEGQGGTYAMQCRHCKASGRFDGHLELPFGAGKRQPWLRVEDEPPDKPGEGPKGAAKVLAINDVRIHEPVTRSVLVIPPESRIRKGTVVDRIYCSSDLRRKIAGARNRLARKAALGQAANELRCAVGDIEHALERIAAGYPLYGATLTQGNLLEKEYQALLDPIPDQAEDEDFVTRHRSTDWRRLGDTAERDSQLRLLIDVVDRVIEISRLKEIMVFDGFRRPVGGDDASPPEPIPPDVVGATDWLPALELYGEGVFFTLNEDTLVAWERNSEVCERTCGFQTCFAASGIRFEQELVITPRFLLLHTLAHLLIRQLETAAGYPAASLKERIYHTAGPVPMAGILIYVAVPDVVGSLGGVVEQAEPHRFLSLLSGAFDHALWCSLDPVCSEHEGQGPNLLNRAGCHACALVPEPSCAYRNVLLDRTFIKGDPEKGLSPFLDFVVKGH